MRHCGTQLFETERLILRRFEIGDAEAMYKNWASDSDVTKYLTWPAHTSIDVSRAVLEDWISSYSKDNYYQWAIVLKDHGSDPIGSIAAVHINDDIDMIHIGYCLGKTWWHQGIMSEALKAVMNFFFDEVGANRIESRHDPRNPNSIWFICLYPKLLYFNIDGFHYAVLCIYIDCTAAFFLSFNHTLGCNCCYILIGRLVSQANMIIYFKFFILKNCCCI